MMNFLENLVPGRKKHRIEAEELAEQVSKKAEQARKNLDSAYSRLGGESGLDVTREQVLEVLKAELGVLQTSFPPNPQPTYADENYFEKALKFHTIDGLQKSSTLMFVRADQWRDTAQRQRVEESDSETGYEAERRAYACGRADKLMTSMSLNISRSI